MNNTDNIYTFFINYFSDWHNALFWALILIFTLYEKIKKYYQKKHNTKIQAKKYKQSKKDENQSYIDTIWEELKKH